ncbi:CAS_1a_G0025660.mRNA.1.CDS.1 [Saccharomyces cerevisiae]|nr:CAS_1a_G0025660.mRNA.1.CDS.1 [Saccharomyces cerevisiae]CAI7343260.1 CAS_1a_G0025660.mRNA.1.CDS.1 [Saccharomyces cerevisiae]
MSYAHGCYSIYHLKLTLLSHSNPWPISHFISTKCTHIIMHGTCLSGLYPVPFTHNAHHYPHFNIYISFGDTKYCITALNTYVIPLFTPYTNHSIYTHLCQYNHKITTKIT